MNIRVWFIEALVELSAGSDSINVLFWSQVNMNASCACILVSRIAYDAMSACSNHGDPDLDLDPKLDLELDLLSGEQDEDAPVL